MAIPGESRGGEVEQTDPKWVAVLVGAAVIATWLQSPALLKWYFTPREVGDTFGALNALFSGLAFVGLIYAILLQRQELRLQRHELISTRIELAGQREALNNQNATLARQNFESSFFQLLGLQHDVVRAIALRPGHPRPPVEGRDCFRTFVERFKSCLGKEVMYQGPSDLERISQAYQLFHADNQKDLAHYFRSLYHVVRFVDQSVIAEPDKRRYTSLVRAHLSSDELVLLFYNCLSDVGREKFKHLVEKYGLLKNIAPGAVSEQYRQLYQASAFAGSTVTTASNGASES